MNSSSIEKVEDRLRLAMLNSDAAELEVLLAPELVFTTFLGELITKEQDLDAHQSGLLKMHSIALSCRNILMFTDLSIVTCLAAIDASFDGERTQQEFRFMRVWAPSSEGQLRVVAGQATLVYSSLEE